MSNQFEMIKEYDGNEVKLYRQQSILSFLDGPGIDARRFRLNLLQNPVPVKDEENRTIGYASVAVINGKLVADVTIDHHTPERLAAELRDGVRQWVRIVGAYIYETNFFLDLSLRKIIGVEIDYLVLSNTKPYDGRLLPFGEPIV